MKPLITAILFNFFTMTAWATSYHFAAIEHLAEQEVGKIIITAVYKKLGYDIEISSYPGKRAEHDASKGIKDGEIMRIWTYGDQNPSLVRVPTPYYYLVTTAFIRKDTQVEIYSKADLAKYRLGRVRGIKHTDNITEDMPNVVEANSTANMFKLLDKGIIDVALADYIDGQWVIANHPSLSNIYAHPEFLAKWSLYHYLHKKHQALVPKVDKVIKEMTNSGELAQLIDNARAQVFGVKELDLAVKSL